MKTQIRQILIQNPEMLKELRKRSGLASRSNTILNTGWRRIPSVRDFVVKVGEWDKVLLALGFFKRRNPVMNITPLAEDAMKMNRYMSYQIRRLKKMPMFEAFKLVKYLMTKSVSFRISAFIRVFPGWYYNMSMSSVIRIIRRSNKIIAKWHPVLDFHRVFIPKSNGDLRPLGVPAPEWRLVLHMWNNFITMLLSNLIGPQQHAYQPGKGTLSCWREILSKVINAPNIYEWDLKKFFDMVQTTEVYKIMRKAGVPTTICLYMLSINTSKIKIPHCQQQEEAKLIEKTWQYKLSVCNADWVAKSTNGVPQGSPTSPFLSLLALRDFLDSRNTIAYADDLLSYGNSPEDVLLKEDPEKGIFINRDKSGWVKKDGVWLKPLKFLGLVYDGNTGTLKSSTRSGKSNYLPEELGHLIDELMYNDDRSYLHKMGELNLFGWIQANLYSGKWFPCSNKPKLETLKAKALKKKKENLKGCLSTSYLGQTAIGNPKASSTAIPFLTAVTRRIISSVPINNKTLYSQKFLWKEDFEMPMSTIRRFFFPPAYWGPDEDEE